MFKKQNLISLIINVFEEIKSSKSKSETCTNLNISSNDYDSILELYNYLHKIEKAEIEKLINENHNLRKVCGELALKNKILKDELDGFF